jgi:hypothetical protein
MQYNSTYLFRVGVRLDFLTFLSKKGNVSSFKARQPGSGIIHDYSNLSATRGIEKVNPVRNSSGALNPAGII